jgi:hypothetical protein
MAFISGYDPGKRTFTFFSNFSPSPTRSDGMSDQAWVLTPPCSWRGRQLRQKNCQELLLKKVVFCTKIN